MVLVDGSFVKKIPKGDAATAATSSTKHRIATSPIPPTSPISHPITALAACPRATPAVLSASPVVLAAFCACCKDCFWTFFLKRSRPCSAAFCAMLCVADAGEPFSGRICLYAACFSTCCFVLGVVRDFCFGADRSTDCTLSAMPPRPPDNAFLGAISDRGEMG